jgi:ABC-type multidrug transport system ATPase subunit
LVQHELQNLVIVALLNKVSKRYGNVHAVRDLTIKIEEGEIVSILGPNGSGKSTILKMLSLQSKPTSGRLGLFEKEPPKLEAKRQIGYLAHESFLYGELTVLENLEFYRRMFSAQVADRHDSLFALIEALGIDKWAHTQAKNLSHGSRKRADLARTLLHNPRLLSLDEPLSGLDPQARKLVLAKIADRDSNRTVVLSLQDIETAREFCDKAIILQDGRMTEEASFG